jgi:hypothetical protein
VLILAELRQIIPAFLTRVDQPDRAGGHHTRSHAGRFSSWRRRLSAPPRRRRSDAHRFRSRRRGKSWPPPSTPHRIRQTQPRRSRVVSTGERAALLRAYVGQRTNRRHKPGRAFERTAYCFDVLTDYGAFRDLQRHRLLTVDWQPLKDARHRTGGDRGGGAAEGGTMDRSAELYESLTAHGARRRALRCRDGAPRPLLHGDERSRGDARHRTPICAVGHPATGVFS